MASAANAHFALAADEALIALTRSALTSRDEMLRLMRLRFDNGASSEIDWRAAQTTVEAARGALIAYERQRLQDRNALALLIGQPLPEALLARPDVRQAENTLRAAETNIGVARAAFWPRITLTGSIGMASAELSQLFSNCTAWSFAPQLLLPLFDASRNRSNLALSQTQRDIAVAQYERTVQVAFREVADALAGRATLGEQLTSVRTLAEAEGARSKLTELRMRNGVASSLELLDAQRSLLTAQQQRVQAELALLQNRIAAHRALGGGWRE